MASRSSAVAVRIVTVIARVYTVRAELECRCLVEVSDEPLESFTLVVGLLVAADARRERWARRRPRSVELGSIDFPTSAKPAAQAPFLTGVKALYNFEFDIAADAFREAQKADPAFALGYWGEAMSYNHPLWAQQDLAAARKVLERLAPTAAARAAKAPAGKERELIEAQEVLFGAGDKLTRDIAYSQAMETHARQVPRRRRNRVLVRAVAARHGPSGRQDDADVDAGRGDRAGHLPAEPAAPGRGALHHPFVRRSRPRDPVAAGRARLLEDRAVGGARAPHAVAHLRAARHVGRRDRLQHRRLQGGRRSGDGARTCRAAARTSTRCRGCSTRICRKASSTRRRSALDHGEGRGRQGHRAQRPRRLRVDEGAPGRREREVGEARAARRRGEGRRRAGLRRQRGVRVRRRPERGAPGRSRDGEASRSTC